MTQSIWTPEEIEAREATAAPAYLVDYRDNEEPEAITDLATAIERARRYNGTVYRLTLVAGDPAVADFSGDAQ